MSEIYFIILFFFFVFFAVLEYVIFFGNALNLKYLKLAFSLMAIFSYTIIAGFREVGFSPDDLNYLDVFSSVILGSYEFKEATNELVFIWINKFVSLFSSDVSSLFLLFAFSTAIFTASSFLLSSKLAILSFTMYLSHVFLYRDMIQIRAGLSYSIAMFSICLYFTYFSKRRYIYPIFALPGLIHTSGFLTCLVPLFSKFQYSSKFSWLLLSISFSLGLVDYGTSLSNILSFLDFGYLQSAVNTYILTKNQFNYELGLLNPTTLKQVFWIYLFNRNLKYLIDDKGANLLLWMYTISTCILLALNDFSTLAARLASFFSIAEFFLIPLLIVKVKDNSLFYFVIALLYCLVMLLLNIFSKNLFNEYGFNFY